MPYNIRKVENGWKVFTKGTDRSHSDKPLSLTRAKEQLKALYANADDEEKKGGSTLLARIFFPTASALYDTATGKNIWTGNGGMIGGFDDRDWDKLFGVFGGAEPDEEEETAKPADPDDTQAILKLDKEVDRFDVEEATGEPEYLKQAKAYAKKAGYKDASSLKLADDGKHKLILRGVKFGSINNNDYIIYKQHFPSIADKKRRQYLARACKIKGDWAKDRYSPNSLAINILWNGSSKKGGVDWGNIFSGAIQEGAKTIGDSVSDLFSTPEEREKERKRKEACKICNEGKIGAGEKKMNFRKDGDDPRNWGYDEEEEIEAPVEPDLPEQPQFIGDPTQFKPQPYDPNNPLMYMVGGAVPLNKKLYERAKEIVYPRYKKPSAYRSGAVVKMYKDMGGKFKDSNGRPLARWFKEEWKDVGNKEYPVYRPTKRISKDTPLTASEVDPENLQLQIKEKQKIKGEKNLKPFLKGGRLAQTDADETKIAKTIMNKVAGEANAEVKAISETPMGDDNIRKYFPNAKILKYSELADIQDITQLLPQDKSFFFLLYEQSLNKGHWVVVNRYKDNGRDTICFFCSYGNKIDGPLYWNNKAKNRELGQDRPYLTELLQKSGKHLQYNKIQYQSKTSPVATCGAFATLWIKANLRDNMNLQDFHDWIAEIKKETGLSYDAIASNAISSRTF